MLSPIIFITIYGLLGLLAFLQINYAFNQRSNLTRIHQFYFLALVLLIGFRSITVGVDTQQFYQWTTTSFDLLRKESLYWNLAALGKMSFDLIGTNLIIAAATLYTYYRVIINASGYALESDDTKDINHSVFLLLIFLISISASDFLILVINQVRQALAAAIILAGAYLMYRKRFAYSLLAFALAPLAHLSALFIAPLVIICYAFRPHKLLFAFFLLAVTIWAFDLVHLVIANLPSEYIQQKVDSDSYQQALTSETTLVIKTFLSASFIFLLSISKPTDRHSKEFYNFFYSIYSLIICMAIVFLDFGEGANRIQRYAVFFLPILICLSLVQIRPRALAIMLFSAISTAYMLLVLAYPSTLRTIGVIE